MITIEHIEKFDEKISEMMDDEFNEYAIKNGVICDYTPFTFVAKDDDEIVGIISGNSYYKEVHISNLIIIEKYRNKHVGTKLVEKVENYYRGKGFENMNLSTYDFQAPEFYKKCGFKIEFARESKGNTKLNKYYLVKYF